MPKPILQQCTVSFEKKLRRNIYAVLCQNKSKASLRLDTGLMIVEPGVVGLNHSNGYEEVFVPQIFSYLDLVLGTQWDCRQYGAEQFVAVTIMPLNLNIQQAVFSM